MKVLVIGGAGYIGSHAARALLRSRHTPIIYDNLSTGRLEFLRDACQNRQFTLLHGDMLDAASLTEAVDGSDMVCHLAANADVRFGTQHPTKDLHQNTIATVNLLEAMRANGVKRIAFASTGSVYGEAKLIPTPENHPFPLQTSLYAASKLAAEGFIEAYCEGFGMQAIIFRFVSILGERYTHGHVFDFYKQLRAHPEILHVLGNGRQRKSYLYVQDCVDAMLTAINNCDSKVTVLNLGTDEYCKVNDSIAWICEELCVQPKLKYAGGDRGWIGDNPFIFLDCSAVRALGWRPTRSIRQSVLIKLRYLQQNPEITQARENEA